MSVHIQGLFIHGWRKRVQDYQIYIFWWCLPPDNAVANLKLAVLHTDTSKNTKATLKCWYTHYAQWSCPSNHWHDSCIDTTRNIKAMMKTKQQKWLKVHLKYHVTLCWIGSWFLLAFQLSISIMAGISACTSSEKSWRLAVSEMYY